MSEILVNTIKKADGTGGLTVPTTAGNIVTTGGATFTGAVTGTDLTLSGGVYLGGTGAANYLDDYEVGTFNPYLSDTGTSSQWSASATTALYRKFGDLVYVSIYIANAVKTGSGNLRLSGLPFQVGAATEAAYATGSVVRWDDIATDTQMMPYFAQGTFHIDFQQIASSGFNGNVTVNDCSTTVQIYNLTGWYITSA